VLDLDTTGLNSRLRWCCGLCSSSCQRRRVRQPLLLDGPDGGQVLGTGLGRVGRGWGWVKLEVGLGLGGHMRQSGLQEGGAQRRSLLQPVPAQVPAPSLSRCQTHITTLHI
jgi:hypothetical protein